MPDRERTDVAAPPALPRPLCSIGSPLHETAAAPLWRALSRRPSAARAHSAYALASAQAVRPVGRDGVAAAAAVDAVMHTVRGVHAIVAPAAADAVPACTAHQAVGAGSTNEAIRPCLAE